MTGNLRQQKTQRVTDLCRVSTHVLVINRTYIDSANEQKLQVEGLTIDYLLTPHYAQAEWFLRRENLGISSVLADIRLGDILKLRSPYCSLAPQARKGSICMRLTDPDYAVISHTRFDASLLSMLYDYLDDTVRDDEIFDDVYICGEQLSSAVTREGLLHTIANSWQGCRWYREYRNQRPWERDVANPGGLDFKTVVCLDGFDDVAFELFQNMANDVKRHMLSGVRDFPDWFRISPTGPSAREVIEKSGLGEGVYPLPDPVEVHPRGSTQEDLRSCRADIVALIMGKEPQEAWMVPPVNNSERFASHSLLLRFSQSDEKTSAALVRFAPDSPLTHVAAAIEDMTKAYLFPDAATVNDYSGMVDVLAWGTSMYSMHDFDLRWGGISWIADEVKAALAGKTNAFAVLSFPIAGFSEWVPDTLNQLLEILGNVLPETEVLNVSCSLNGSIGGAGRLSLFSRLPEVGDSRNVGG